MGFGGVVRKLGMGWAHVRVIGTCTWEMCGMIVMMAKKAEGMIVEWGGWKWNEGDRSVGQL